MLWWTYYVDLQYAERIGCMMVMFLLPAFSNLGNHILHCLVQQCLHVLFPSNHPVRLILRHWAMRSLAWRGLWRIAWWTCVFHLMSRLSLRKPIQPIEDSGWSLSHFLLLVVLIFWLKSGYICKITPLLDLLNFFCFFGKQLYILVLFVRQSDMTCSPANLLFFWKEECSGVLFHLIAW